MNSRIAAAPGQWYLDRGSGSIFQIVSVDEDDRSLDIQYADGSLEEAGFDEWVAKNVERCEQPEDWVGPFDDLESDDIGLPEPPLEPHGAEGPMERMLLEIEERRALLIVRNRRITTPSAAPGRGGAARHAPPARIRATGSLTMDCGIFPR